MTIRAAITALAACIAFGTGPASPSGAEEAACADDFPAEPPCFQTELIFADGFESGDPRAWSSTQPPWCLTLHQGDCSITPCCPGLICATVIFGWDAFRAPAEPDAGIYPGVCIPYDPF